MKQMLKGFFLISNEKHKGKLIDGLDCKCKQKQKHYDETRAEKTNCIKKIKT